MVDATISRARLRELACPGRPLHAVELAPMLRASAPVRRRAPERPARAPVRRSHDINHLEPAGQNGPVRISAKADYAIRAMVELAAAGDGPIKGERLAQAQ